MFGNTRKNVMSLVRKNLLKIKRWSYMFYTGKMLSHEDLWVYLDPSLINAAPFDDLVIP